MKNRAKAGDIFYHELSNGQFMFGKVLLDIYKQCIEPKKVVREESYLRFTDKGYVVQVYDGIFNSKEERPTEVLIPGVSVFSGALEDGLWIICDHEESTAQNVDFEEVFYKRNDGIYLRRGEVFEKTNLSVDEYEDHDLEDGGLINPHLLFDTALILLNKEDLQRYSHAEDMVEYDKRFGDQEIRKKVYEGLGVDVEISYYDLALKYGYDTARFFE